MELSVKQRQYLKGLAHDLNPVVMIGDKGLTDAVIKEVITSLNAHEIIKIRVLGDDRKLRTSMIDDLCQKTNASLVQHIGKLLVLYRGNEAAKIVLPKG
ncbi:MAG: yhbY [Burkholderiales bacterium]|jgi:RNA-binding protein|nr:yhbY [Burkholderiales bacterium]